MSRIRYASAAILVCTLRAQTAAPPAANSGARTSSPPQSQPSDTSPPPPANPSSAATVPPAAPPPPDSPRLELIKKVKPEYPPAAAPEKLQGQVVVRIVVSETGDVESVEVISENPVLAAAAVDAVKQWKFKPYIRTGQSVKSAIRLPFDFAPPADAPAAMPPLPAELDGILTGLLAAPPAGARIAPPTRIRVSSGVMQGLVIHKMEPTYPSQALQARVQGTVVLRALISKEGTIEGLQVVSGHPLLTDAAIEAVKRRRCRPFVLNGEPVEVDTQIIVNFTLRER